MSQINSTPPQSSHPHSVIHNQQHVCVYLKLYGSTDATYFLDHPGLEPLSITTNRRTRLPAQVPKIMVEQIVSTPCGTMQYVTMERWVADKNNWSE